MMQNINLSFETLLWKNSVLFYSMADIVRDFELKQRYISLDQYVIVAWSCAKTKTKAKTFTRSR